MILKQTGKVMSGSIVVRLVPKKRQKSRSKIMFIVFFDIRGDVHHKYVPEDKSVNAKFYIEVLM